MCFVDLEPCEVWRETERKARKPHRCSCCRGTIPAGDEYLVHFSVFQGDATSEKMCLPCRDDRKAFADAHEGTLCTPSFLREMVAECVSEDEDGDGAKWAAMLARIKARRALD